MMAITFCQSCSKQLAAGARFCHYCGQPAAPGAIREPARGREYLALRFLADLLIIAGIIVLVAGLALGLWLGSDTGFFGRYAPIIGFIAALLVGFYALALIATGQIFRILIDLESNTHQSASLLYQLINLEAIK